MKAQYVIILFFLSSCQSASSSPRSGASAQVGASQVPGAADALDQLDSRKPVPLLPTMAQHQKENMRDHLAVVEDFVTALGVGDFAKVAQSAKRMGYSETMAQMCQHMGSGAPGFTEQALTFHHTADHISEAAAKHDSTAVLAALAETLAACTTCHAAYKQKVVDKLPE